MFPSPTSKRTRALSFRRRSTVCASSNGPASTWPSPIWRTPWHSMTTPDGSPSIRPAISTDGSTSNGPGLECQAIGPGEAASWKWASTGAQRIRPGVRAGNLLARRGGVPHSMLYDDIRRLVRAARRGCAAKDGRFHAAAVGAALIASRRSMQVVVGGSAGEREHAHQCILRVEGI